MYSYGKWMNVNFKSMIDFSAYDERLEETVKEIQLIKGSKCGTYHFWSYQADLGEKTLT